jgi:hypothetical protein
MAETDSSRPTAVVVERVTNDRLVAKREFLDTHLSELKRSVELSNELGRIAT